MQALKQGLRMGFTGGSDTHSGRPGGSAKEPCRYWGGLTGVWADSLTRGALFKALYERRTCALTGARIVVKMTVNDVAMVGETGPADSADVRIDVWAPGPIARVEVLKNAALLRTFTPDTDECHIETRDEPQGAAFYHCRLTMQNGHLAVGSPVWVG